ncbi:phospholipase D family protein [Poseidonibacter antarcticus]|uniref:phospholipase D family protein n=1 Tax=Poseidonibacter antarcticus TaxID=2478538 RepID=UPI000EF54F8C|nr:phospholipase D family protein [Poseidonibacter antarcticus]
MKFLTTTGLNFYLENILKNAKDKIVLITPYIKIHDKIKNILKQQKSNGVEITIVCREEKNIDSFADYVSKIYVNKDLHAKCYFNESEAIITSLNLYEFSQVNNREMGIYINTNIRSDISLYADLSNESESLIQESIRVQIVKETQTKCTEAVIRIINVKIVKGKTLCKYWNDDMQSIVTTKGEFIAELPNKRNKNGYEWKKEINKELKEDEYRTESHSGFTWLYKSLRN